MQALGISACMQDTFICLGERQHLSLQAKSAEVYAVISNRPSFPKSSFVRTGLVSLVEAVKAKCNIIGSVVLKMCVCVMGPAVCHPIADPGAQRQVVAEQIFGNDWIRDEQLTADVGNLLSGPWHLGPTLRPALHIPKAEVISSATSHSAAAAAVDSAVLELLALRLLGRL